MTCEKAVHAVREAFIKLVCTQVEKGGGTGIVNMGSKAGIDPTPGQARHILRRRLRGCRSTYPCFDVSSRTPKLEDAVRRSLFLLRSCCHAGQQSGQLQVQASQLHTPSYGLHGAGIPPQLRQQS